jgi:predicted Rossmann fold nucleotide-binding protein DprA/Smf involved in DNA uptake
VKRLVGSPWVVVSGFHSPVEKECLRVLLRSEHPVIVCPARTIESMRVSKQWDELITNEKMLLLSPFERGQNRITERSSVRRNLFVAALAEKVWIPHVSPESKTEKLTQKIEGWGTLIDLMDEKCLITSEYIDPTIHAEHILGKSSD